MSIISTDDWETTLARLTQVDQQGTVLQVEQVMICICLAGHHLATNYL